MLLTLLKIGLALIGIGVLLYVITIVIALVGVKNENTAAAGTSNIFYLFGRIFFFSGVIMMIAILAIKFIPKYL